MKKFEENSNNIFKVLISGRENIGKFKNIDVMKNNIDNKICEDFCDLRISSIKAIHCNGLHTGSDFNEHWNIFLMFTFDENFDFGDTLAKNTLGYQYFNNGVPKDLLPEGIGLIFKIVTTENIVYQFIIKMSLVETEEDLNKLKYNKNKSKIIVDVSVY